MISTSNSLSQVKLASNLISPTISLFEFSLLYLNCSSLDIFLCIHLCFLQLFPIPECLLPAYLNNVVQDIKNYKYLGIILNIILTLP